MGRGFGRGAKSVAIVTHAQVKNAKKTPRGLRAATSRKKRRSTYASRAAMEDPSSMMDVGDYHKKRKAREQGQRETNRNVEQQIAAVNFPELVTGKGRRLKTLRKTIVHKVKELRRNAHMRNASVNRREEEEILRRVAHADRKRAEAQEVERVQAKLRVEREAKAAAEAKRAAEKKAKKAMAAAKAKAVDAAPAVAETTA
jgi:hypothetical protein